MVRPSGADPQHVPGHGFGDTNTVDTRREDPAGITGTFTRREQALDVQALHRLVTGHAQRRGGAGFNPGQHRVMQGIALDLPFECRQGFANGFDGEVRQRQRQVAEGYARLVGRFHTAQGGGRLAGDKVTDQLRRGFVVAATEDKGVGLQALLQLDTGQRAARIVDFRGDADDDPGVGITFVARVLAHAVGDHPVWLGSRRHHGAARAHAEAVDRTTVLGVVHQLVVGRAEFRVPGVLAQARAVDQRLRVFDTETHRERLGFHVHATTVEHAEGVAGAMTQGHDHVPGVDLFAAVEDHAVQLTVFDQHVGHPLLEAHFTAQGDDLLAHVFHHAGQTERTDVRLADVEDFFRCAGLDELVQHFAPVEFRVFDLAVELAIGKGPGAALTELHVGLRVEHTFAPQAPGVLGAFAHFLAALEDDRLEAHLRQ